VSEHAWEEAYVRFETPEEEARKFQARLEWLGAQRWPRDAQVVELFCGRGGGLVALERLGFTRLEGVDRSAALLSQYGGSATCHVADCLALPLATESRDFAVVQGGLHHLEQLPADLERALDEMWRILRPGGRAVVVEPWLTPFLELAHAACRNRALRRLAPKLDAFAAMIENELETYMRWLGRPDTILAALERRFVPERRRIAWGKLYFVGRRRERSE